MFTWFTWFTCLHAICSFHSLNSTQTFWRALTASVDMQLRGDKECPFSGVTNSGRAWRKVPGSNARTVIPTFSRLQSVKLVEFAAIFGRADLIFLRS